MKILVSLLFFTIAASSFADDSIESLTQYASADDVERIKKSYNSCVTSCKEDESSCPTEGKNAEDKCRTHVEKKESTRSGGIQASIVANIINGDYEISDDVTRLAMSIKSNSPIGQKYNHADIDCMEDLSKKINSSSTQTSTSKGRKILTKEITKSNLNISGKHYMYTDIGECISLFGDGYLEGKGKLDIGSNSGFCADYAAIYCKKEVDAAKKDKAYGEKCSGENQGKCEEHYEAVESCMKDYENDAFNKHRMVAGCISLRELSHKVKELDLEDNVTSYQSIDGEITCKLVAPYTMDYGACVRAVYWYNSAFLVADVIAPVAGNVVGQVKSMDINSDAQAQAMQGVQTASLDQQRKHFELKKNNEVAQGTLQAGKAMAMFFKMTKFPTPKYVTDKWCLEREQNAYNLKKDYACSIAYMAKTNEDTLYDLFANQKVKEQLLKAGAFALSKAIVHGITASMMGKQADMVQEVKDAYVDAEFTQDKGIALAPTYCEQNPSTPSCLGNNRRFNNNSLEFGTGVSAGGGQTIEFGSEGEEEFISDSGASNAGSPEKIDNLNNLFNTASGNKGAKGFDSPGVASVSGKSRAGGGGGGGGGLGGGGGGAGAGGGPAKKGAGASQKFGKGYVGKTTGGSNAKSFSGGGSKSKSNDTNPFANLVGNSRSRGIATVETDKNLIPERFDLFDKISKKYAEVHKTERIKASE